MLLSPGNSPRHLSSPSPSLTTQSPQTTTPPQNPRNSPTVLDEDAYVASIERIVERDFFPDIPKLRDRLVWLQAVRSRDPLLIRDAQLQILHRRHVTSTSSNRPTPTPTPFGPDRVGDETVPLEEEEDVGSAGSDLSLDGFFKRYTSEDNESFSKILEKVNRKRKERCLHLTVSDEVRREKLERGDTDGYGTSDQPLSTLQSWKFTPKNLLMYHPADNGEVALTDDELGVRVKGLTKEINRANTRFHGKMTDRPREEDTIAVLYSSVPGETPVPMLNSNRETDKGKRYDLEDLRKTPNGFLVETDKKAENGYRFVRTPSPAPGIDSSPFLTWGEIEGTPLRLSPEDTPIGIGGDNGPQFNIPLPHTRDLKAHSLSRVAARKMRERGKMFSKPPLHSPSRGNVSPNPKNLSPAAQKFMRDAIAKSSNSIDESLRASYRSGSPGLGTTPKSGRSLSRLARDETVDRSPSIRDVSNPPW